MRFAYTSGLGCCSSVESNSLILWWWLWEVQSCSTSLSFYLCWLSSACSWILLGFLSFSFFGMNSIHTYSTLPTNFTQLHFFSLDHNFHFHNLCYCLRKFPYSTHLSSSREKQQSGLISWDPREMVNPLVIPLSIYSFNTVLLINSGESGTMLSAKAAVLSKTKWGPCLQRAQSSVGGILMPSPLPKELFRRGLCTWLGNGDASDMPPAPKIWLSWAF